MTGLAAGSLNRRVRIERAAITDDNAGGEASRSWSDIGGAWVSAVPVAGKEALLAGTLRASQGWRIEMRPRDVTIMDRLKPAWLAADVRLAIQSVADPDGMGQRIVLFCETTPV